MSVYNELFEYQQNIVNNIKDKLSYGLFLDMGLGKTPIAVALSEINNCSKILVVTLNNKACEKIEDKGSWGYWFDKSSIKYNIATKTDKPVSINSNVSPTVLITNYESLFNRKVNKTVGLSLNENIKDFIKLCEGERVCLIIDESHKLKNLNSLQTKSVFKIQSELKRVSSITYTYILTGTPFTIGYIDLYSQLKLLGYSGTKTAFIDKYCIRGNIKGLLGWQQPIVGYKNVDDLYNLIHRYAITIKSNEVINLPESIFIDHKLPKTTLFDLFVNEKYPGKCIGRELKNRGLPYDDYNTITKINNPFYRNIAYPNDNWLCDTVGTFFLRCKQISIGFQGNRDECKWFDSSRLKELYNLLETERDNYVIFYNYTAELIEIFDICDKLDYNIDVYCGEIKKLDNYTDFCKLDNNAKLTSKNNVIIANYASGSTGMNWQEYNKCILFSVPLYKDYEQCLKRVHRIGQRETVFYHIFYQDNWFDKKLLTSLKEKKEYDLKMFEQDLKIL